MPTTGSFEGAAGGVEGTDASLLKGATAADSDLSQDDNEEDGEE